MKVNGKTLNGPSIEVIVIPRQGGDLVFKAQSVLDYEPFYELYPTPQPPQVMRPGGVMSKNVEDPKYKDALTKWSIAQFNWMFLQSLRATEGLEWDTVKYDDPDTWDNYRDEMKESGLSPVEIGRIQMCVTDACGLNQDKIDEATKSFLAGQAQALVDASSLSSEPTSTPSGEPVNASA